MPLVEYAQDPAAVSITWKLARRTPDVWRHLTSEQYLPEWLGHVRGGGFSIGEALVVDHGDGHLCTSVVETIECDRRLGMTWEFPENDHRTWLSPWSPAGMSRTLWTSASCTCDTPGSMT